MIYRPCSSLACAALDLSISFPLFGSRTAAQPRSICTHTLPFTLVLESTYWRENRKEKRVKKKAACVWFFFC